MVPAWSTKGDGWGGAGRAFSLVAPQWRGRLVRLPACDSVLGLASWLATEGRAAVLLLCGVPVVGSVAVFSFALLLSLLCPTLVVCTAAAVAVAVAVLELTSPPGLAACHLFTLVPALSLSLIIPPCLSLSSIPGYGPLLLSFSFTSPLLFLSSSLLPWRGGFVVTVSAIAPCGEGARGGREMGRWHCGCGGLGVVALRFNLR